MNVNRKLDRFKQWAGERMGGEARTSVSNDFKALEAEMNRRHEGMDRIYKSTTGYIKAISKRSEGDDKERTLPIARLGSAMVTHGEEFDQDSQFGQILILCGRAHERLALMQENYVSQATSSWLEGLERSLAQMKEYQAARKKLESRRLAYDASLAKVQKAKKEDFRLEEELRTQKAKYEEANDDVYRRMQDIRDAEVNVLNDLTAFVEAEINYHDRCREVLLQLRKELPSSHARSQAANGSRSRPNVAGHDSVEEAPRSRPAISHTRSSSTNVWEDIHRGDWPSHHRHSTVDWSTLVSRKEGPFSESAGRMPSDSMRMPIRSAGGSLRCSSRPQNTFADPSDDTDTPHDDHTSSPSTSSSDVSRTPSWTTLHSAGAGKKAPPPLPSRAKKPPPPPPIKRAV
ncbi:hypothetical protein VTN31DRAFT_7313 [Thermomyces dupontii]|uniref:uncharacterized protein n=1 Tax=Talaromyces thermophilus TaxID=28565 RepID=UPI00374381FA